MSQSSTLKPANAILIAIALLLMPLGAVVGDTAQWILIGTSIVLIFACSYHLGVQKRRSDRS